MFGWNRSKLNLIPSRFIWYNFDMPKLNNYSFFFIKRRTKWCVIEIKKITDEIQVSVLIQFFRHLSRYQYGYQIWCSARYSSKSWPGHSYRTFHGNSNTVLPSKHMPVFKNFLRQNLGSFKYNLIKTGLNFSRPLLEYGSCFMRSIKIACEMVFLFNFFPFYNIAWKAITMENGTVIGLACITFHS